MMQPSKDMVILSLLEALSRLLNPQRVLMFTNPIYVFLARHLLVTDSEIDSRRVVDCFGHRWYRYGLSNSGHIRCSFLPNGMLLRSIFLVIDPRLMKKRFGLMTRFQYVHDIRQLRS